LGILKALEKLLINQAAGTYSSLAFELILKDKC